MAKPRAPACRDVMKAGRVVSVALGEFLSVRRRGMLEGRRAVGYTALRASGVIVALTLLLILPGAPLARTLKVGPGEEFASPAMVAGFAADGEVVEIQAGHYPADAAVWKASRLTIRGVGGRPHITADGRHAEGKAIWLILGNDVTIENVEMSGARVPARNGAAIRAEGRNLTLRGVYFHDNENGLLAGKRIPGSVMTIEHSEFARNGVGDGQTHNLYVGGVDELVVRGCYFHGARSGQQVKSRAATTRILYSLLADGDEGNSSYLIDLSNGGRAFLVGNVLQQGVRAENSHLVSFGHEGIKHPVNALYVINNTFVNDRSAGQFLRNVGATEVRVVNNVFYGVGEFVGAMDVFEHNLLVNPKAWRERLFGRSPFRDLARRDYRLAAGSPAIDAGIDPGEVNGVSLRAEEEYQHPARSRPRPHAGAVDLGAFEYVAEGSGSVSR